MQIRQRMFNCTDVQTMHFILDKILKLLTYYTPFYHQSLQSYLSQKQSGFFGPPCRGWPTSHSTLLSSTRQTMIVNNRFRASHSADNTGGEAKSVCSVYNMCGLTASQTRGCIDICTWFVHESRISPQSSIWTFM